MESEQWPKFVKADVKRVKRYLSEVADQETDLSSDFSEVDQPEWMELIAPNAVFDDFTSEFQYDDGGPDFDWSIQNHSYPPKIGVKFLGSLSAESELDDSDLQLPEVELNYLKLSKSLHLTV